MSSSLAFPKSGYFDLKKKTSKALQKSAAVGTCVGSVLLATTHGELWCGRCYSRVTKKIKENLREKKLVN